MKHLFILLVLAVSLTAKPNAPYYKQWALINPSAKIISLRPWSHNLTTWTPVIVSNVISEFVELDVSSASNRRLTTTAVTIDGEDLIQVIQVSGWVNKVKIRNNKRRYEFIAADWEQRRAYLQSIGRTAGATSALLRRDAALSKADAITEP